TGEVPTAPSRSRLGMGWIVAIVFALIAVGLAWIHFREAPPAAPQPIRFQIYPPDKTRFASQIDSPPQISPDGEKIAFSAAGEDGRAQIWVRNLESLESKRLDGSEDGFFFFWSADSRWIAFRVGPELKKIPAAGGPVQSICICVPILPGA